MFSNNRLATEAVCRGLLWKYRAPCGKRPNRDALLRRANKRRIFGLRPNGDTGDTVLPRHSGEFYVRTNCLIGAYALSHSPSLLLAKLLHLKVQRIESNAIVDEMVGFLLAGMRGCPSLDLVRRRAADSLDSTPLAFQPQVGYF